MTLLVMSVHDVEKENDVQVMNDRCLSIWYDLLAARTFGRREGTHQLAPKQASMVQYHCQGLQRSRRVLEQAGKDVFHRTVSLPA